MQDQWDRLEVWLEGHMPELRDDLNPGCSPASLDALEALIGRRLPNAFRAFYQRHDGQAGRVLTGPFFGLMFLPLRDVAGQWSIWQEVLAQPDIVSLQARDCTSAAPYEVKGLYASPHWIPFAHDCGRNHLGIDLDPGPGGTVGQVINFGRDEKRKFVLAPSLAAFLDWMLDELESGNYSIEVEPNGFSDSSFNMREPASSHFLDAAKLVFAP